MATSDGYRWRGTAVSLARACVVLLLLSGTALGGEVTLLWTAPGENGSTGQVAGYDVRYDTAPIGADTVAWWGEAVAISGEPVPSQPGEPETLTVAGLAEGTPLFFLLRSFDESGNTSAFSNPLQAIANADSEPPALAVSSVRIDSIRSQSARISWATNVLSVGFVRYGADVGYGDSTGATPLADTVHSRWITGLAEGALVHFQVVAAAGAERDSTADSSFVTLDPPPAAPGGVEALSDEGQVLVRWDPGAASDLAGYRVYSLRLGREETTSLLDEGFDEGPLGSDPADWMEEDGGGEPGDAFRIVSVDGRGDVYGAAVSGESSFAVYAPSSPPSWGDVMMTGAVRVGEGAEAALLLRRSSTESVRFRFGPERSLIADRQTLLEGVSLSDWRPDPETWYRFRVVAWEHSDGLRLLASFQAEGEEEMAPLLWATDTTASAASEGTVALGAAGDGEVWFDDLEVRAIAPSESGVDRGLFRTWGEGGLSPDSSYHYFVTGYDEAGTEGPPSEPAVGLPAEIDSGAPPDTTGPVLGNIRAQNVSTNSATIAWEADERCDGEVRYGKTTAYEIGSVASDTLAASHRLGLSGLGPSTLYHYQVKSADSLGNETVSADYVFLTQTQNPDYDPEIDQLTLAALSDSDAVVQFETNIPCRGFVDFGEDTTYGVTVGGDAFETVHSFYLAPLEAAATYHFRARAVSEEGDTAFSADQTLTTSADTIAPSVALVEIDSISRTGATIRWRTDEGALGKVEYGLSTGYGAWSLPDTSYLFEHVAHLEGLAPGAVFHFRLWNEDRQGNMAVSGDTTFETATDWDTIAPVLSNIAVDEVTCTSAVFTWRTDEEADGQVEIGLTLPYGRATPLADSLCQEHSLRVGGLRPASVYHFRVLSRDGSGNLALSDDGTFTTGTVDLDGPEISGLRLSDRTATGITVEWSTDRPATGQVEYGMGGLSFRTAPSAQPAVDHAHRIEGLQSGVLFAFRVVAWDAEGAITASPESSFTLDGTEDLSEPAILAVSVDSVGETWVRIGWLTDEPTEGRVEYGPEGGCDRSTPTDTTVAIAHLVEIGGLEPHTTYCFQVVARDAAGNVSVSQGWSFTTAGEIDTVPPLVEGANAVYVGNGVVWVAWRTEEPTVGRVEYGLTSGLSQSTAMEREYTSDHEVEITGLSQDTLFYIQAVSWDEAGNAGRSEVLEIRTSGNGAPGPSLAGDVMVYPGVHTATLHWVTEGPADSRVEYGKDPSCPESAIDSALVISHSLTLEGLDAEAVYYCRILASDSLGNVSLLKNQVFSTLADTASKIPSVSSADCVEAGVERAVIVWSTDIPSVGNVEYGRDTLLALATPLQTEWSAVHSDTIEGLLPSTLYYYRVRAAGEAGIYCGSALDTFRTAADLVPPPPPAAFTAAGGAAGITIRWSPDPSETPSSATLHRRIVPGGDWEEIWSGGGGPNEVGDTLTEEDAARAEKALYYLAVEDAYGNVAAGDTVEVLFPKAEPVPVSAFRLHPNRPNPFNPTTTIRYEIPSEPARSYSVRIAVFNIGGEEIRLLLNENLSSGAQGEVLWDGNDYRGNAVASGTYFYRFEAGPYSETRRMVLIR